MSCKNRSIATVALLIILLFVPAVSHAAMTCVDGKADGTVAAGIYSSNKQAARIYVTCTFDTTPGTAVDDMPDNAQALLNNGWYAYRFSTIPGSTGPTDNSDLQILDGDDITILSAAGNGADVIDNATITPVIMGDGVTAGSDNFFPLGDGSPWEITVTNNAVNSSSFTLVIQAIRYGGDNR